MTDSTPRAGGTHKRPKDDGHRNYPRADACPDVATHTPHPTGYLAHCEWMDEKAKTHRQRRCPTCLFWAIWEPTDADTGHTSHSCDCGHPWDSHMAVVGGCSTCSCMAHPPNQPEAPA